MIDWQNIIALGLVGLAAGYLARGAWRRIVGHTERTCGSCSHCGEATKVKGTGVVCRNGSEGADSLVALVCHPERSEGSPEQLTAVRHNPDPSVVDQNKFRYPLPQDDVAGSFGMAEVKGTHGHFDDAAE